MSWSYSYSDYVSILTALSNTTNKLPEIDFVNHQIHLLRFQAHPKIIRLANKLVVPIQGIQKIISHIKCGFLYPGYIKILKWKEI